MVSAPRFRRYFLIYLSMFIFGWIGWRLVLSPRLQERNILAHSLDPTSKTNSVGWFGANSMPEFGDLIQIQTLDPGLVPTDLAGVNAGSNAKRRLVIVGDVHGCKEECELYPFVRNRTRTDNVSTHKWKNF
jgi:hypothetical protein